MFYATFIHMNQWTCFNFHHSTFNYHQNHYQPDYSQNNNQPITIMIMIRIMFTFTSAIKFGSTSWKMIRRAIMNHDHQMRTATWLSMAISSRMRASTLLLEASNRWFCISLRGGITFIQFLVTHGAVVLAKQQEYRIYSYTSYISWKWSYKSY